MPRAEPRRDRRDGEALYTPVPGKPKCALRKEKLPETHQWFVAHVDSQRAVARESKAAHKKDKAPRKP
jgi:hypothetical protein